MQCIVSSGTTDQVHTSYLSQASQLLEIPNLATWTAEWTSVTCIALHWQKQWPLEKVGTLLGLVIICSTSKSQDCKVCLICHSHLDGTYLESETDKSWRKSLGENDLMVGFDYCRVQNQVIYFHLCTFCNMARYSEINHLFLQDKNVFLRDKNVFLICTLWDVAIYSCFHCGISGWISYTLSQDYCCHRHGCRCHHINCCRCYHDQHQDTLRLFTL